MDELSNFAVIFMSVQVEGLGVFYLPESGRKKTKGVLSSTEKEMMSDTVNIEHPEIGTTVLTPVDRTPYSA